MAIDLTTQLSLQLRDETNATWTTAELGDLLDQALDQANQYRQLMVRDVIALINDQDTYVLTNVHTAVRVDLLDEDSKMIRSLAPGTWEIWGDNNTAGQSLYVNPLYARVPYKIRVHGYAPYNFSGPAAENPSNIMQKAILALARAEALRRIVPDRVRFRNWAQSNPRGDTSVNELLGMMNESDSESEKLLDQIKLIKRPMPGRF